MTRARSQPLEDEENFTPCGPSPASAPPVGSRSGPASPSPPALAFPPATSLSPSSCPRRLEAGRAGRGRAAEPTVPRSREERPSQTRRTERPARRGVHEVGRARASERGRGGDRSRRRLEPARCAMELEDPGALPPPPLALLLLLGIGLLPGKFRALDGPPFVRVQGSPGPRKPEEGRLLAAVPNRGCAQRGSRGGSRTPDTQRLSCVQRSRHRRS